MLRVFSSIPLFAQLNFFDSTCVYYINNCKESFYLFYLLDNVK